MEEGLLDVKMTPTVDTKEVIGKWIEKLEKGVLSFSHFQKYWRTCIPRIYSPSINESCLNWAFNEDEAVRILFNPLQGFIFNCDPEVVLNQPRKFQKQDSICGRNFKIGEPTYSCRECGMHNTRVLCGDCFRKSEHRLHKYKMGSSGGGGCCDCGDKEAWKKAPYCSMHLPAIENQNEVSNSLPVDLAERVRIVYEAVLQYASSLLTLEISADLRLGNLENEQFDVDTYCTVVYSCDEVHTFEPVSSTLYRVIKCSERNAIEYATNIDREGRAVVKCSSLQHCNDLKTEIEKLTSIYGHKPLKVLVVHAHVIAHELFALKLLLWLQECLRNGEGFRDIFAEIALKQANPSIIEGILLRDAQLWKSARTHWHRLLISGMLREYENKKSLAKMFIKNYDSVMKNFIKDNHDHHSFSVLSLSVQLFTVPTLAHHLIANDDVLFILLKTFISECSRNCNKFGKFEFESSSSTYIAFERAQCMLNDLKYLLSAIPEIWTNELRTSFLQGLSVFLNLLTMMESMNSVTRQIGQHMDYEPEWNLAFNLHIKLAYCVSLTLKWCGSDKIVLIEAYRATLKKLYENPCYDPNEVEEVRELVGHSIACLPYDVSTKSVSIHLPLTRFLAGLHLHLENYGLHFGESLFATTKPTPVQIIEPVVRTQVMIAQIHAGMWHENGLEILNPLFLYHNVKHRMEMLDRDIQLLQIGASLIESNEFLIHLLNKYNLINWANPNFETNSLKSSEDHSMRKVICIVEEFLQLLINIVGARHVPGISDASAEDRIKMEIIHQLCIKPLPHSELNEAIPDDITHETTLDDVIDELAVFKKPALYSGQGVYELREKYFDNYNVFFYHYTLEELSKSEETQRKRRNALGKLDCCPPSALPKLKEPFSIIVNLLQCDVMLHIMKTVLERCINLKARSFSELQLHKVLHLIGYALQEEKSLNYPFLLFTEKAAQFKLSSYIEELIVSPRIDSHKDLLRWTLQKFKQFDPLPVHVEGTPSTSVMDVTPSQPTILEKMVEKQRKSKLAAHKRVQIMAQITAMQNQFIIENATLFEKPETEPPTNLDVEGPSIDVSQKLKDQPICLGPKQTSKTLIEKTYICILCKESQRLSIDSQVLVLAGFVQKTTVLCTDRSEASSSKYPNDPLLLNSNRGPALHTSTCGHVMHATCWERYFDSMVAKKQEHLWLRHNISFDVDKNEFLCPLCECLSNTVLPLVPPLSSLQSNAPQRDISFSDWLSCVMVVMDKKVKVCHGSSTCPDSCLNLHCYKCKNFGEEGATGSDPPLECDIVGWDPQHQMLLSCPCEYVIKEKGKAAEDFATLFEGTDRPHLWPELIRMVHLFVQTPYTRGLDVNPHPSDKRLVFMTWKSLSYTLNTTEVLLRDSNKPLLGHLPIRHHYGLESFIRIAGVLSNTFEWIREVFINHHSICLLSMFLDLSNHDYSILQWDSVGMLVALTFSMPCLFENVQSCPRIPTGGSSELHILRLIFIAHIVKLLIILKFDTPMDTEEVKAENVEDEFIYVQNESPISYVLRLLSKNAKGLSEEQIWYLIRDACLPFLRCCVLFYSFLTDVPPPVKLTEVGGDTFSNMCSYLGLPKTRREIFESEKILPIIKFWCSNEEVLNYLKGGVQDYSKIEPRHINQLVELPGDYSELINTVSSFMCPNGNHKNAKNPTMCLVCGEILCFQSYCCQTELHENVVGACNYHAHKCGAGVGVFLRVRECEMFFLATPSRGCFVSPPYLDDYGETDHGLRRGNPLHLCREKYKKLHTQWLSHSIHEEIARAVKSSITILTTDWQNV